MLSSKENTQRLFSKTNPERAGLHDGSWARTLRKWTTQGYPTHTVMKARDARFLFGSDHSISTNTHYEDFQYLLEVYHEHMAY